MRSNIDWSHHDIDHVDKDCLKCTEIYKCWIYFWSTILWAYKTTYKTTKEITTVAEVLNRQEICVDLQKL